MVLLIHSIIISFDYRGKRPPSRNGVTYLVTCTVLTLIVWTVLSDSEQFNALTELLLTDVVDLSLTILYMRSVNIFIQKEANGTSLVRFLQYDHQMQPYHR